jgi:hypothetical protein
MFQGPSCYLESSGGLVDSPLPVPKLVTAALRRAVRAAVIADAENGCPDPIVTAQTVDSLKVGTDGYKLLAAVDYLAGSLLLVVVGPKLAGLGEMKPWVGSVTVVHNAVGVVDLQAVAGPAVGALWSASLSALPTDQLANKEQQQLAPVQLAELLTADYYTVVAHCIQQIPTDEFGEATSMHGAQEHILSLKQASLTQEGQQVLIEDLGALGVTALVVAPDIAVDVVRS